MDSAGLWLTLRGNVATGVPFAPLSQDSPVARAVGLHYHVGDRVILDGCDLEVIRGESVAVIGPSGAGKSTLLLCLAGLLRPSAGKVFLAGNDLTATRRGQLAALRLRHVGFVYQFGELLPELTPLENVALPALMSRRTRSTALESAEELLIELGVESVTGSPTIALSGGERQRVAVARALITEPDIILADEPTGSLDEASVVAVADLLFSLPRLKKCALVVVTHNERVARRATRCFTLAAGQLVTSGK